MAAPREGDDPQTTALRAVLRDPGLMARVTADVEDWPPLTEDQRATISALFTRKRRPRANPPDNTTEHRTT
jgi:hypothetical protein